MYFRSSHRAGAPPETPGSFRERAFTLIELLAVISIMAVIAAMVGPSVIHFRKGDAIAAAGRQTLDAVARARQLAISEHTTVYMVFLPTNFWSPDANQFVQGLTSGEQQAVNNVIDKQLTGYTFVSLRSVGDQPGRPIPRYLASWQTLPQGSFIPPWKFTWNSTYTNRITNPINRQYFDVAAFRRYSLPFPAEDVFYNQTPYQPLYAMLPYIAFNYLGQLSTADGRLVDRDEYIPLAQGSVLPVVDEKKIPVMGTNVTIKETPPGNSVASFNLVHIDRLTGRARLERQEVQ